MRAARIADCCCAQTAVPAPHLQAIALCLERWLSSARKVEAAKAVLLLVVVLVRSAVPRRAHCCLIQAQVLQLLLLLMGPQDCGWWEPAKGAHGSSAMGAIGRGRENHLLVLRVMVLAADWCCNSNTAAKHSKLTRVFDFSGDRWRRFLYATKQV
jgi:hypothetical protein